MNEGSSLLMYAISGPVVLKYAVQLILVQAGLFLLPVAIALFYAEYEFALRFVMNAYVLAFMASPFIRLPVPAHICSGLINLYQSISGKITKKRGREKWEPEEILQQSLNKKLLVWSWIMDTLLDKPVKQWGLAKLPCAVGLSS